MERAKKKKGGIIKYGEAEREQNKADQKRGTRLSKKKICIKKSPQRLITNGTF